MSVLPYFFLRSPRIKGKVGKNTITSELGEGGEGISYTKGYCVGVTIFITFLPISRRRDGQ